MTGLFLGKNGDIAISENSMGNIIFTVSDNDDKCQTVLVLSTKQADSIANYLKKKADNIEKNGSYIQRRIRESNNRNKGK
jgi:hypothetical protein